MPDRAAVDSREGEKGSLDTTFTLEVCPVEVSNHATLTDLCQEFVAEYGRVVDRMRVWRVVSSGAVPSTLVKNRTLVDRTHKDKLAEALGLRQPTPPAP